MLEVITMNMPLIAISMSFLSLIVLIPCAYKLMQDKQGLDAMKNEMSDSES